MAPVLSKITSHHKIQDTLHSEKVSRLEVSPTVHSKDTAHLLEGVGMERWRNKDVKKGNKVDDRSLQRQAKERQKNMGCTFEEWS